jgi:hypothetical protein
MSKVVTATNQLEEQLRTDGYKGTHRALRILKNLRQALETNGYSFSEETEAVTAAPKRRRKKRKTTHA